MRDACSDIDLGFGGRPPARHEHCTVEVHHDVASLAEPWIELEGRAGGTIFQSYAWCSAWAEACHGAGRVERPCVVTVWKGRRLVLLWPLAMRRLGPFRVLQSFAEPATQNCDALIEPGAEQEHWLHLAWGRIRAIRGLDAALLKGVRADAAIATLAASWDSSSILRLDSAPFVDFRADASAGPVPRRSSRTRNALQRHLRHLAEHGQITFAMLDSPAERADAMREALRLKQDWLNRTAQVSAGYAHPANGDFLERLAAREDFIVARLSVGGATAAVEAGLLRGGYYWSLVQSYEARYALHGPGRLLFWHLLERASALGIEVLDLLAPAYPHKREWTNGEVPVRDYAIPLGAWSWVVISYVRHARPRLKGWLQRMPKSRRFAHFLGLGIPPL